MGASGSVYGLFGVLIALLMDKDSLTVSTGRSLVLMQVAVFASLGLLMGWVGFVDNAAHLGGLACGLVLGAMLRPIFAPRFIECA